MSEQFQKESRRVDAVTTKEIAGVTSASPAKIFKVPKGSAIKIYPTSAGTATVYSSSNHKAVTSLDTTNANITGSTNASWDEWGASAVTAKTTQAASVPLEAVALVVSSGTWVLEVSA